MYKWGGVVTDHPMDSCYAVFAGVVGREALRRRLIHVPARVDGSGGTLVAAVRVAGLDVTFTMQDRRSDRRVVLEVRSDRPEDENTAISLIGRFAAGLVPVAGPGRRPPSTALPRSTRRRSELVSATATTGRPAASYPHGDSGGAEGPLALLLRRVGWAVTAPWGPIEGDPDEALEDLVLAVDRMADPLACLHWWSRGALPADGLVALGVAALVVHHTGWPTAHPAREDPGWHRLLDACLGFLRAHHVDRARVPSWAWERWMATGGNERNWLAPCPLSDDADPEPPTPLGDDEVRLLAVTGPGARLLVTCRGAGYVALDDTDTRPGGGGGDLLFTLAERDDLYDCYQEAAWVSPYRAWAQPELEPFFPVPPPDI